MTSNDLIGLGGVAIMLLLLALRMPIGIAMLLVGVVGFAILNGLPAALAALGTYPFQYAAVYDLAIIPLFVLMGNCAAVSGMGRDLFKAAYAWVGHWRGGLASATIAACAGFAAVSGSSVAAAITMGRVCLPEMKRYNYNNRLATGTIAAGGTLGILIPPSTAFVVYGILTEQSIGRLLLAGILPGILLTVMFLVTITIWTRLQPSAGPSGPRASWPERRRASMQAGPMLSVVLVSIGGIYAGVFTVSEAAAVGGFLALVYAVWRKSLGDGNLNRVLVETISTTAMVFLILIGAQIFGPFLALSGLPSHISELVSGLDVPRVVVLALILMVYLVLGCFLEGFSMLVLTLPIVIPIVNTLGYDLIWFGVVLVIVLEMGLISPPVGINVFVVKGLVPDVSLGKIFAGILPFWVAMMICTGILIAVPDIALLIPNSMIQ